MQLEELFKQCLQEVGNDRLRAERRFLIAAKKNDPQVKMRECMQILGYTSDDEKKDAALGQSFRLKIFNPIRDHIAKIKLGVSDTAQIFGRTGQKRTEEQLELKKQILSWFPSINDGAAKTARQKNNEDMSYVEDLIS